MGKVNFMNLDKFEIAAIRRNYATSKRFFTQVERKNKQIEELIKERDFYQQQIDTYDQTTKSITKKKCGIEIDSKKVIELINDSNEAEYNAMLIEAGIDVHKVNTENEMPVDENQETPFDSVEENTNKIETEENTIDEDKENKIDNFLNFNN